MNTPAEIAAFKDLEINRKFLYLNEVNLALNVSVVAAKKYLESINKFIRSISRLKSYNS